MFIYSLGSVLSGVATPFSNIVGRPWKNNYLIKNHTINRLMNVSHKNSHSNVPPHGVHVCSGHGTVWGWVSGTPFQNTDQKKLSRQETPHSTGFSLTTGGLEEYKHITPLPLQVRKTKAHQCQLGAALRKICPVNFSCALRRVLTLLSYA